MFTDNQIRRLIDDGAVSVTPFPEEKQFQPTSFDWRIGAVEIIDDKTIYANHREYIRRFSEGPEDDQSYEDFVGSIDEFVDSLGGDIRYLDKDEPFVIEPGQQAIMYSLEQFKIPDWLFPFSELRSSNGRRGLFPGDDLVQDLAYEGRVKMSVVNKNPNPLRFYGGDRFAQLFFEAKHKSHVDIDGGYIVGEDCIRLLVEKGLLEVDPDVVIKNDQLVFTCSDTALSFKRELGTICTREKYEDDIIYDKIDLSKVYELNEEDFFVIKLEQNLKLSNQVGILLKLSQSLNDSYLCDYKTGLNVNHIFNHKVGAGWVDPGYEGQVTIHDWTHFVNQLAEGKAVMTGIVYFFPEPVGNSYGSKGLGSHYVGSRITASA